MAGMPGSPGTPGSGSSGKRFSVEEANRMLPELQEVLQRLRDFQARARRKYDEMRDIRAVGYCRDGNLVMLTDYQLAKREFDEIVAEANRLLAEVQQRGCRITDVEEGLVDFPAQIGDEEVMLCWKLGEPRVAFYHRPQDGFRGRKPLPSS